MGEITNRDAILNKVSVLFEKMHQNQKLQQLAEQNNLDIKNTIKLTDDNMMNVAVTLVALSLAKEANDPRYKKLVNTGLQKRSLKLEIINDYKKEANDIIKDYSSGNFNKEPIQEGFFGLHKPHQNGGDTQWWKGEAHLVADKWVKEHLPEDLEIFLKSTKDLNDKCFTINGETYIFKKNEYKVADEDWLGDYEYDTLTKGFLLYHSDEIRDPSEFETIFEKYKDNIPNFNFIEYISRESNSDENWTMAYSFSEKEYVLFNDTNYSHTKDDEIKLGKSWTKFMEGLTDSDEDDIQQEGFLDIFKSKPKESPKPKRVPQNLDDVAEIIGLKDAGFDFPEDFKKGYESEAFKKLLEDPKFYVIGKFKHWASHDHDTLISEDSAIWEVFIPNHEMLVDWNASDADDGVINVCGLGTDDWVSLNCKDGKYYMDATWSGDCDNKNLMFNNFKEFFNFLKGKHLSEEEVNNLESEKDYWVHR